MGQRMRRGVWTMNGEHTSREKLTDADIIAAIRNKHKRANLGYEKMDEFTVQWDEAWVDPGGTIFGPGPYLKVPIHHKGKYYCAVRVYAPERLRRSLAERWIPDEKKDQPTSQPESKRVEITEIKGLPEGLKFEKRAGRWCQWSIEDGRWMLGIHPESKTAILLDHCAALFKQVEELSKFAEGLQESTDSEITNLKLDLHDKQARVESLERVRDALVEYFEFLHRNKIITGAELQEAKSIAEQDLTGHAREHPEGS